MSGSSFLLLPFGQQGCDVKRVVSLTGGRRDAGLGTIAGVKHPGRASFECAARTPGTVCVIGSETALDTHLGSEYRCAMGHVMVPYPLDGREDLNAWRSAWRASRPVSLGGVW